LLSRQDNFLSVLAHGIYAHAESPYLKLLNHAGVDYEVLAGWVREDGIEAALARLYDLGVYITHEEFKGHRPVQRPGLEFPVGARDFDNPRLLRQYEVRTGGSRGVGTRISIDFDFLAGEALYDYFHPLSYQAASRPMGVWMAAPPGAAGRKLVLCRAKIGKPVERWFAHEKVVLRFDTWKYFLFTNYAVHASKLFGRSLAPPEYVPLEEASKIATWLSAKVREGTPAWLATNTSSAIRVCLAARDLGLDISGSFFRVSGEPYSAAQLALISASGGTAVPHYGMSEAAAVGRGCPNGAFPDDCHIFSDKLAVVQRDTRVGNSDLTVGALYYTTLIPSCPKLMLNVGSGDYGVLEKRECGCLLDRMGFKTHLHAIRSFEKLTSEGMTFLGGELNILLEEVLPKRFGGQPTDYQIVEQEEASLPQVSIVVSPRIENVVAQEIIATVIEYLSSLPGAKKMMAERWRQADTLKVVRRNPYVTPAGKILPLHILSKGNKNDNPV